MMDWIRMVVWPGLLSLAAGTVTPCSSQVIGFSAPGQYPQPVEDRLWGSAQSERTSTFVTQRGLTDVAHHHPRAAFALLEQGGGTSTSDSQRLLTLAELADQIGRTTELTAPGEAILWSRDAAVYAMFCLTTLRPGETNAVTWRAATDVHNGAVARCLRLVHSRQTPDQSSWPTTLLKAGIVLSANIGDWMGLGFDSLQTTDEFVVARWNTVGRRRGLGIPVIARRRLENTELTTWKPYGPLDAVFAATAVIQPHGSVANWRQQPVELVLHDPLREEVANLGGWVLPLAGDLTTPLIHRLAQSPMRNYEYLGAIDPASYATRAGVYAIDSYQPGKIPVLLVQGIWSSPKVWAPMLDTLRGDPKLRAAYQFWVALYPSCYPLPIAALSLRQSLRETRQKFDPRGTDLALDQMVILGKSTGGQVTRMLVEPSGELLWNAIFTRPIDQVCATPELLAQLAETFFFQPEPYVRRVIFVATAHRGNQAGAHPLARFGVGLIQPNNPLRPIWAELEKSNGRTLFQPHLRDRALSSADGLEAENPMLMALAAQPISPDVAFHSIIANIRHKTTPEKICDGIVDYRSAHIDGATSERIVTATHVCEADREVIDEVRRILYVHLAEQRLVSP
jgi:hypothetical protein